jgi:hypothetical protein
VDANIWRKRFASEFTVELFGFEEQKRRTAHDEEEVCFMMRKTWNQLLEATDVAKKPKEMLPMTRRRKRKITMQSYGTRKRTIDWISKSNQTWKSMGKRRGRRVEEADWWNEDSHGVRHGAGEELGLSMWGL